MLTRMFWNFGLTLSFLLSVSIASAAEWGSIEGQFVAEGKIDVPIGLRIGAIANCGGADIPDESVVVNPKNQGIANVFVYLRKAPADIHPDLIAVPTAKVICDQKNCRFLPHAMVVRVGQPVNCINSDALVHNLHTNPISSSSLSFMIPPKDTDGQEIKFDKSETLPVKVVCDIHLWMDAYWLVTDHPYVAVTDADGKFKIENLPVGEHSFRVWQERCGYVNREYKVKVVAGKTTTLAVEKVSAAKLAKK